MARMEYEELVTKAVGQRANNSCFYSLTSGCDRAYACGRESPVQELRGSLDQKNSWCSIPLAYSGSSDKYQESTDFPHTDRGDGWHVEEGGMARLHQNCEHFSREPLLLQKYPGSANS